MTAVLINLTLNTASVFILVVQPTSILTCYMKHIQGITQNVNISELVKHILDQEHAYDKMGKTVHIIKIFHKGRK
jgi:hypothetical protein